jgi:DNA-binding transcriptional LysR family regulator
MLDFRQLLALRALAEHGSVLAAAEALGWSQPTVTHHLTGLSRLTNAPVVESSRAGTRLTPAGRLWLPHAIAMLARSELAQADVAAALATGRRRLRLGIFPTAAARLLPDLVAALTDAGYDPRVTEGELHDLTALLERLAIDAAVVFDRPAEPAPSAGLRRTRLFSEHFSLIVRSQHPLAHAGPQPLDAFRDEPWILGTSETDPGDAAFITAARTAGFEPSVGPRSDDYRVVTAYVSAGLGVALVPELALPAGDDRPSNLAVIELTDTRLTREVSLLTAPTLDPSLVELMTRALTTAPTV